MSFLSGISNESKPTRSIISSISYLSAGHLKKISGSKPSLSYGESIKPKNKSIKGRFFFPSTSKRGVHAKKNQHYFNTDCRTNLLFDIPAVAKDLEVLSGILHDVILESTDDYISQSNVSRIFTNTPRLNSIDEMISHITFATDENTSDFDSQHVVERGNKIDYYQSHYHGASEKITKQLPFIKVILGKTDDIVLFEKLSLTLPDEAEESNFVKKDNELYEYLTAGKGRYRRKNDAETQTIEILYKSKCVNTNLTKKFDATEYVSNYDMYDTYEDIEKITKTYELNNENDKLDITTYKIQNFNFFEELSNTHRFNLAVMLTQRLLAENVFRVKQKRFRNIYLPDPLSLDVKYLYRLEKLWKYPSIEFDKSISHMCWCPHDGDILAVAYGIFHIDVQQDKQKGYVAVWNIKNPINPERKIEYDISVLCVEFSKFTPQLLAVGLYDGTIEVRDITDEFNSLVGTNRGGKMFGSEPIIALKWISDQNQNSYDAHKQSLLAVSTDGNIIRYQLARGYYLLGFLHIRLDRIELEIEGLLVSRTKKFIEANRYPQIFDLVLHPVRNNEFYALTDEGCYFQCSANYPQQHLDAFQLHQGSVFCMDWSPFSPKVFLTCGSDWYIRIWITGIYVPIINLSSGKGPINCAYWSPTHSFIIIGVTTSAVEIWDIRRSLLKPVSSHDFRKKSINSFTVAQFSKCGRSIAIGDTEGNIILAAFEDMPFSPHFQYDELEKVLYKATMAYPDLILQIQNLGYFGYENYKAQNSNLKNQTDKQNHV